MTCIDISPKRTYKWPKEIKICSITLIIRKMQVKTIRRYHLISVRMANRNKTKITSHDVERLKLLCTASENVKWCSHYGKQYEVSLKKLKIKLPYDSALYPISGYNPKEIKNRIWKRYLPSRVHCSIITVAKMWKN